MGAKAKTFLRKFGSPASEFDEMEFVHRILQGREWNGTMVDIGAHRGTSAERFAHDGWSVFCFEPNPVMRQKLRESLGWRSNVNIDSRAVSTTDGTFLPFFTSNVSSGISTLSPFHESHRPTHVVETIRLDSFIAQRNIEIIDLLKVDVEGHEKAVFEGFEFALRPEVIVCEFEDSKSTDTGFSASELVSFLNDASYDVLISEWHPIVRYGTQHRWKSIYESTTTMPPSNSWGNVIAFDRSSLSRPVSDFLSLA